MKAGTAQSRIIATMEFALVKQEAIMTSLKWYQYNSKFNFIQLVCSTELVLEYKNFIFICGT